MYFPFNRLGIQSKLVLLLLAVSLGSIAIVAWISYVYGKAALTESVKNQLQGIRTAKTNNVKAVLNAIREQVIAISDSQAAIEGMKAFRKGFRDLEQSKINPEQYDKLKKFYANDFLPSLSKNIDTTPNIEMYLPKNPAEIYLQYHYIAANPNTYEKKQEMDSAPGDTTPYGETHKKFHGSFGRIAQLFGFEDLMLVDSETLEVVYTYQKSIDFATNYETGPLADTNVANMLKILRKTKEMDDFKMADFESYRPNLGIPMAFAASPIFSENRMIGILLLQFPIQNINSIMTSNYHWEAEGLGKTGETYLVGPDHTMRSRSRFMYENPKEFVQKLRDSGIAPKVANRIEHQGNVLLTLPVKTTSVEQAFLGKTGIQITQDYRGQEVVSAYGPVELDSLRWAVIAEMDTDEAYQPIREIRRTVILTGTALALTVSLIALVFSNWLVRPIRLLAEGAKKVSAGNVDVVVKVNTRDEFRQLAHVFNEMTANLKKKSELLQTKIQENDDLLMNILPGPAIASMRKGDGTNQAFADVSLLHASIQGLGEMVEEEKALEMVQSLVVAIDEAAEKFSVEKVKTVGASYLAVCGLSFPRPDHSSRMAQFAEEIVRIIGVFNKEKGTNLTIQIGINAGPVVGGVVGRNKFIYDLWGDTVNLAKNLSVQGEGMIHVSQSVYEKLQNLYSFKGPFPVEIRGKGTVPSWNLTN